jgi:hypothetical protein
MARVRGKEVAVVLAATSDGASEESAAEFFISAFLAHHADGPGDFGAGKGAGQWGAGA